MRIYLIASTPYTYLHHRFQKLADEFRAMSVPVTYVEQTYGWRAYLSGKRKGLRPAVASSLRYHADALKGSHTGKSASHSGRDFEIIELPLVIPTNRINSATIERMNAAVYRQVLRSEVTSRLHAETESVAIVDNPMFGAVIRKGDFTRIYYDCIDDVTLYSGRASLDRFLEYERQLVESSDALFATALKLEEHLQSLRSSKPIHRLPNGVDFEWFQKRVSRASVPDDLKSIKRPIVGYVGTIADWLDYAMVAEMAKRFPLVSFVFVGPVDFESRLTELEKLPNFFWLGKKEYIDVPAYIAAFDVCWIPFASGRIVEHTNPIKLFEYFALGKPVVTTPLVEAEPYEKEKLVYFGGTPDALAEALRKALADKRESTLLQRMGVAREHSWKRIVARMKAIVSESHG